MWKPGSSKPNGKKRNKETGNSPGLHHDLNSNEKDESLNEDPKTPSKKLSGATRNMRFMQRKVERDQQQRQYSNAQRQQNVIFGQQKTQGNPPNNSDDSMQVGTEDASSPSNIHNKSTQPQDYLVDVSPATTSDMYGISVDLIGRRSFGGFNRSLEETFKSSYRAHRQEQQEGSKSRKKVSDEELLQRYSNLVRNRGSDDNSRRPVGNLREKVRPRKNTSNGKNSGEKRKRR